MHLLRPLYDLALYVTDSNYCGDKAVSLAQLYLCINFGPFEV